jgi:hypothetical protein
MATEVEICNLALSHLGDEATVSSIDPPEGSPQAEHCARFYPIARDVLLEMHDWSFATRRVTLPVLSVPSWSWMFAYAWPSECIRILAVLPYGASTDDDSQDYETESISDGTKIILTNAESASCRYIAAVNETSRFPPLFVESLARLLASYLAGKLVKGEAGRKAAMDQLAAFNMTFARATVSDANQKKGNVKHTPSWIGVR